MILEINLIIEFMFSKRFICFCGLFLIAILSQLLTSYKKWSKKYIPDPNVTAEYYNIPDDEFDAFVEKYTRPIAAAMSALNGHLRGVLGVAAATEGRQPRHCQFCLIA